MTPLKNITIFMTGANSGLGLEAAISALEKGTTIYALVKTIKRGETLSNRFSQISFPEKGQLHLIEGDLNSFETLRTACEVLKSKQIRFDQLIFNAGIMNFKYSESANHIEETLQVNLLSSLFLLHHLLEMMDPNTESRVIFTSSALHFGTIQFADLQFKSTYSALRSYSQSKLGVILLCRWLAKKEALQPIKFYVNHPGIVRTNLSRSAGWFAKLFFHILGKSPKKGSQTLFYLMSESNNILESGAYYRNSSNTKSSNESYDMALANKLLEALSDILKPHLLNGNTLLLN